MSNNIDINATFTPDDEPADLQPEMVLAGKYRLIKQIGKGAMGVVWQAHDGNRQVALKFVPKECSRFTDEMERMRQSFNKIHALNHQSICPTYDLVNDGDFGYFLVMKFLEGETLDDYRLRKDPKHNGLPLDQVLELVKPVAQALDYAHRNDVIHRDIKPSNIFLSETAKGINVEIIDFGLADEVREGMSRVSKVTFDMSGTPAYMAPEQWKGARQTAATDQYALAVIVYELLAGHLPFSGSNIENAVLKYDPEPIREMPEKANAALLKALAKQGADRFATCQDFMDALAGVEIVTKAGDGAQRSPGTSESAPSATQSSVPSEVISLMKRARLFLEDSDWQQATQYFNRVLDIDAEFAPAYAGLLFAELQIQQEDLLGDHEKPISEYKNFQKAVRFASAEYKATLKGYDEKIRERIQRDRERLEAEKRVRQEQQYRQICESTKAATTEGAWRECAEQFRAMEGYKNTAKLAEQCNERANTCREEQMRIEKTRQPGSRTVLPIKNIEYPFRWCPTGTFIMGSPASEAERRGNETQHQVTLSRGFWLLETPVTQGMWENVMGNNPSCRKYSENLPVENVSWQKCQGYIENLNSLNVAPEGYRFSLPTETQWEYACRAGTTTPFHFGSTLNGDKANCRGGGTTTEGLPLAEPSEVGNYPANAWGLYDMHGNVWEWCADWFGDYPSDAVTDPMGASSGSSRVIRGGGWFYPAVICRSASRYYYDPSQGCFNIGFRIALVRAE